MALHATSFCDDKLHLIGVALIRAQPIGSNPFAILDPAYDTNVYETRVARV